MTDHTEETAGVLGNFHRRRRIEKEAALSREKAVGRIRPKAEDRSASAPSEIESHSRGRLVDEES